MTRIRAIRGATQLAVDSPLEVADKTSELVSQMLSRNGLAIDDCISLLFTATPDVHAAFPAAAARKLGMGHIPLLCAQELDVAGALPLVIRVLLHAELDVPLRSVNHVYLHGAMALRQDLAQ